MNSPKSIWALTILERGRPDNGNSNGDASILSHSVRSTEFLPSIEKLTLKTHRQFCSFAGFRRRCSAIDSKANETAVLVREFMKTQK
jgi:hypothetical protein